MYEGRGGRGLRDKEKKKLALVRVCTKEAGFAGWGIKRKKGVVV